MLLGKNDFDTCIANVLCEALYILPLCNCAFGDDQNRLIWLNASSCWRIRALPLSSTTGHGHTPLTHVLALLSQAAQRHALRW